MADLVTVRTFTKGDTDAVLSINTGRDLTGYTAPVLKASDIDAAVDYSVNGSVAAPASAGIVTFDCASTLASAVGVYRACYQVTNPSSKVSTSPDFQVVTKDLATNLAP